MNLIKTTMHNHAQPCTTTRWFLLAFLMICCFNFLSAHHFPHQKKHENPEKVLAEEINKASYVFEASCIESYKDITEDGQPIIVNKYQIHKIFKGDFDTNVVEFIHNGNPRTRITYDGHGQKKEHEYTPKLTKIGTTSTFVISDNKQLPNNHILSLKIGSEIELTNMKVINLGYPHTIIEGGYWNSVPDAVYYGFKVNETGVKGSFKSVNDLYSFILSLETTSIKDITNQNLERPRSYLKWKTQQETKKQFEKKKLPTNTKTKH